MKLQNQIEMLEAEIKVLEDRLATEKLLQDIWHELGPYTNALTPELRCRLQDHFNFDDSE